MNSKILADADIIFAYLPPEEKENLCALMLNYTDLFSDELLCTNAVVKT